MEENNNIIQNVEEQNKKEENKKNKKVLIPLIAGLMTAIILAGASFAYYSATVSKTNETKTMVETNKLGLIFEGEKEINYQNMIPGDSFEKTFSVENTSNRAVTFNIYMQNITNQFNEDLVYKLYETDSTYTTNTSTLVAEQVLPNTSTGKVHLKTNLSIGAAPEKKYYKLVIEYKYLANAPQNDYQGKNFVATLGVDADQQTYTMQASQIGGYEAPEGVQSSCTDINCNVNELYDQIMGNGN